MAEYGTAGQSKRKEANAQAVDASKGTQKSIEMKFGYIMVRKTKEKLELNLAKDLKNNKFFYSVSLVKLWSQQLYQIAQLFKDSHTNVGLKIMAQCYESMLTKVKIKQLSANIWPTLQYKLEGSRYEEIDFKHIVDLAFNGIGDLSFNLERTLV
ncbi:hypothetical protein TURU_054311 [Turdus rufiventris]|nr:hypothetical protein TURU_054311 [Turdus rufiventris]